MKSFIAMSLFLSSIPAFASCPDFDSFYSSCESTHENYQFKTLEVSTKGLYHRFLFENDESFLKINAVADGKPTDVTAQREDGTDSTVTQMANCQGGELKIIRTREHTQTVEEIAIITSLGNVVMMNRVNGNLRNITSCRP